MSACPSDEELAGFVAGALESEASRRVSGHIDTCARCREVVALALSPEPARALVVADGARIGRFVVIGLIGRGGMGAVFSAYDPDLDRKVALKLVRPDARGSELQLRLVREAQAMARLHHPEVITVYETGETGDDVFIAMEFVDGGTLRDWLRERPRSVAEIVERFARAGDGLAAAHAAGLVHRDFKPDNVLVGSDGRQRVTDFGLARATGADGTLGAGEGVSPDSPLHAEVTAAGALVGTPAYMAPEQLDGAAVDARADQFSFCVALYQALYGALPFAADNMRALRAAMARNEVRAPPRGTRVQSRLRAVLVRGLRALPDERFPSMAALVAELRRRARPRVRPAAVVAALAFLVGAGALTASLVARDRRCAGVAREAASAWGAAESARVHDAFARAKLPFFDAVWATTSSLLDGYARELGRRRVEVCAATELRREQPEPVRQLRDACLRDRQRELVSLVDLFAAADAATVERAPQIASALPSFEPCDDVETLRSETRSPRSRQEGLKAAALRQRLDAAWARQQVGHDQGLGDELATIASEAKALDYAPIEGAALYRLAMWKSHVGDLKAAQPLFEAAATRALAANNDVEAELSWSELARLFAAGLGKPKEAELWLGFADAAEKRRRGHDGYTVDTINTRAQLEIAEGKLGDAEKSWERAIALIDELHMSPILRVEYEGNRAIAQARQWRLDAAEPTFRHVLEEHRRLFGDDHPDTVTARENMVQLLNLMGRFAEALPLAERGLAERLATQGANGGDLPDAQHNLAESLVGLGRAQEGLGHSRAALAILTPRVGADSPALADYLVPEGEALVRLGQRAAGLRLLEAALAKHEAAHDEGIDLAPTELALARAIVSGAHSSTATARAIALATAARAAHLEAAARWGGNNQARADEIAAFIRSASATGPRD